MLVSWIKSKPVAIHQRRRTSAAVRYNHGEARCYGFVDNQPPLLSCARMHECICQCVVNRQFVVRLEAWQLHVLMQSEVRNQTTEISLDWSITQEHEIPRRLLFADIRLLISDFRPPP